MTEQERIAKKWAYIKEHFPDLAELMRTLKEQSGHVNEPLLFNTKTDKPLDRYTRKYVNEHRFKVK